MWAYVSSQNWKYLTKSNDMNILVLKDFLTYYSQKKMFSSF